MKDIHFNAADLNLVKVLDALVRELSVARAARRLGVTPSAVSHALRRLREMLRDPIVVRSGRAVRPTPRALELAPLAASICESARQLLSDVPGGDPRNWQETLRVVGSDYALAAWIFPALSVARREAPGLRVAALTLDAVDWERQLIDGAADFAVRDQRPVNPKLRWLSLGQETYVVVMRRGHPLSRGRLDLNRYCRATHAMVSVMGGGFHGGVDSELALSGTTRTVSVSVPTFLAGIALVRRSELLLSLPKRLADSYDGIVSTRPLPIRSPSFEVTLVWHARTDASALHRWFRGHIKEVGADPVSARMKSVRSTSLARSSP